MTFLAITCGHPGNPTFGMTQGTQFNLNDAVRFVCNIGYVLQGAVKSTCQANGQWSNALPRCKSKYMLMLSVSPGGISLTGIQGDDACICFGEPMPANAWNDK